MCLDIYLFDVFFWDHPPYPPAQAPPPLSPLARAEELRGLPGGVAGDQRRGAGAALRLLRPGAGGLGSIWPREKNICTPKWKHGSNPAVAWWFHFDPYPCFALVVLLLGCRKICRRWPFPKQPKSAVSCRISMLFSSFLLRWVGHGFGGLAPLCTDLTRVGGLEEKGLECWFEFDSVWIWIWS